MTSIAFFHHHSILKTYFEKDKQAGRGIQTFNYSRAVTPPPPPPPPTPPKKKNTKSLPSPVLFGFFFRNWKNADIQVRTGTDSTKVVMRRKKAESRAPGDWAKNRHPRKRKAAGAAGSRRRQGEDARWRRDERYDFVKGNLVTDLSAR
jgi:hypothetical protein